MHLTYAHEETPLGTAGSVNAEDAPIRFLLVISVTR